MTSIEGTVLDGRYRIDAELGRGGMGVVYRGTQLALDRPVAIKRLLGSFAEDSAAVGRFRREAIAAGRLAHPGIVGVFDAGFVDGEPYLVMELVDGEPLDVTLARRRRFEVDEALLLAWQLGHALAAAHDHGIVHRDVKPANVMLGADGRARLLDFGLARLVHARDRRVTVEGAFVGTPEYLAPEVARGAEPDARADVYALGITLYELLTGTVPFTGPTLLATVLAHLREPLEPPSSRRRGVPPEVDALVARLLARDPEHRPRDAGAALDAIDRAMGGLDAVAPTAPPAPPASVRAPRHRTSLTLEPSRLSHRDLDAVLLAALAGDGRNAP